MTQPASATPFDYPELDRLADQPEQSLDRLIARLEREGRPRPLLDALLLRARWQLDLPVLAPRTLADLPEPLRTRYEDAYVEALRRVGQRLLADANIAAAWPYYRMLGEKQPIVDALESTQLPADHPDHSALIDIAFNQGAHPAWGLQRILDLYGICSAITAFEHLPTEETIRAQAAERLTRALHDQLVFSLRSEIQRQGEPAPPESATVADLIRNRPSLFDDDAYHIDTSHLASVTRMALLLREPAALTLARDLVAYGQRLSIRYKYAGEPPFEDLYDSTGHYLDALLGHDADRAIDHFLANLPPVDPTTEVPANSLPAQVLVGLLDRLGQVERAMELAIEHLADVPESQLNCPTIPELCRRANRTDRLADFAQARGDAALFAAATLTPRRNQP